MPTKLAIKSVTITIFMSSQLGREPIESNMLDKHQLLSRIFGGYSGS